MPDVDLVTLSANIEKASEKIELKPDLFKQDLGISGATAAAQLTIWQETTDSPWELRTLYKAFKSGPSTTKSICLNPSQALSFQL